MDPHSVRHLYDRPGPSVLDETLEYAPPEVLFGDGVPCSAMRPQVPWGVPLCACCHHHPRPPAAPTPAHLFPVLSPRTRSVSCTSPLLLNRSRGYGWFVFCRLGNWLHLNRLAKKNYRTWEARHSQKYSLHFGHCPSDWVLLMLVSKRKKADNFCFA